MRRRLNPDNSDSSMHTPEHCGLRHFVLRGRPETAGELGRFFFLLAIEVALCFQ